MKISKKKMKPIDFEGLKIYDYTANAKSNSSFAVVEVPPGKGHRESFSKRSDKYYYVVKGEVDFLINREKLCMKAGDFCMIPKGKHFRYKNSSGRKIILFLVHIPSFKIEEEVLIG
jgi:mannose-6-phosphate isomerase-like protein (cupin superfamily)